MHRRSLSILATMALGLTALVGVPLASAAETPSDDAAYVALGDSEAAGTGNIPYVDSDCLRSTRAYPVQLARMLGTDVVSAACAGASTQAVAATQLGALGAATQLVTITAGANNLQWRFVLIECRTDGDPARCAEVKRDALAALADLPAATAQMLAAVRSQAPNAQIFVTGYPMLFGDLTAGTCSAGAYMGALLKFSAAETQFINGGVHLLNAAIAGGVASYAGATGDAGVSYVDVAAHFDGHGLCDTGDRWVSGMVSGVRTVDRSFHLNAPGMHEYAIVLEGAIAG